MFGFNSCIIMNAAVLHVSLFSHYLNALLNEDFERPAPAARRAEQLDSLLPSADTDSASLQTLLFPTPGSAVPSRGPAPGSRRPLPSHPCGSSPRGVSLAAGLPRQPVWGAPSVRTVAACGHHGHKDGDGACMTRHTGATLPSV